MWQRPPCWLLNLLCVQYRHCWKVNSSHMVMLFLIQAHLYHLLLLKSTTKPYLTSLSICQKTARQTSSILTLPFVTHLMSRWLIFVRGEEIKNKTTLLVLQVIGGALVFKSQFFWTSDQILDCKFSFLYITREIFISCIYFQVK